MAIDLINKMETMTGAKALMTAMEKEGVKQVFGNLLDAIFDISWQDMNSQQLIWLMDLVG